MKLNYISKNLTTELIYEGGMKMRNFAQVSGHIFQRSTNVNNMQGNYPSIKIVTLKNTTDNIELDVSYIQLVFPIYRS